MRLHRAQNASRQIKTLIGGTCPRLPAGRSERAGLFAGGLREFCLLLQYCSFEQDPVAAQVQCLWCLLRSLQSHRGVSSLLLIVARCEEVQQYVSVSLHDQLLDRVIKHGRQEVSSMFNDQSTFKMKHTALIFLQGQERERCRDFSLV